MPTLLTGHSQAPISFLDANLDDADRVLTGRVDLEVHCSGAGRSRRMMQLYKSLSSTMTFQVLRVLQKHGEDATTIELRLRESVVLGKLLQLLPGVLWVDRESASPVPGAVTTIFVVLGEKSLPLDEWPETEVSRSLAARIRGADEIEHKMESNGFYDGRIRLDITSLIGPNGMTRFIHRLNSHPSLTLIQMASGSRKVTAWLEAQPQSSLTEIVVEARRVADVNLRHETSTSGFEPVLEILLHTEPPSA